MPKVKNIQTVSDLKDKLAKAKSVIITDYRGLTHKQLEELHRALKKVGAEYVVVKNSLISIASSNSKFEIKNEKLVGPTAALLSYEDEIAAIKELYKTIKNFNLPQVKFGFIGANKYNNQQVEAIAKLPAYEILQSQLVGTLGRPIYGLVYSLNYNLQQLAHIAHILSQIQSK